MRNPLFDSLAEAARGGEPVALGIISGVKGSSPQKLGAKALFYPDGRIKGTLGGGCLEAEIQHRAIRSLQTGRAETFDLLLDHDFGWDDGLICGGKVQGLILPGAAQAGAAFWASLAARQTTLSWGIKADYSIGLLSPGIGRGGATEGPGEWTEGWLYQETLRPPCALWIAGAGHIAQAVAPIALQLDFSVTVFDDRPALASPTFFPPGAALLADTWERLLERQPPAEPSFALIVTRGHRHDALVLRHWIHQPFRFIGMIGSKRKARTIFEHFAEEQLASPEQLARVSCPVGIKIRSRSVAEIAVSIAAQLIDKRAEVVYERDAAGNAEEFSESLNL